MRNRFGTGRKLLLLFPVLGVGWLAGRALAVGGQTSPTPLEPRQVSFSTAAYDSATVRLRGALSGEAKGKLALAVGARGAALVVIMRGSDSFTCEDLGRQLRELRRHSDPALPLVVWTEPGSVARVREFLSRERVPADHVEETDLDRVSNSGGRALTPAVLLTRDGGESFEGVAHTRRFPNSRVRSFSAEMEGLIR